MRTHAMREKRAMKMAIRWRSHHKSARLRFGLRPAAKRSISCLLQPQPADGSPGTVRPAGHKARPADRSMAQGKGSIPVSTGF